jgi:opacity protein-like surface antigen
MKRVLLFSMALVFGSVHAGLAADMVLKAPVPPEAPPPYNWSGLYLGANFGSAWSSRVANISGADWDPGATAFIGGVDLGYNWQFGRLLVGVEGNFDGSVFGRPTSVLLTTLGPVRASAPHNWIGTVAARLGIAADKWLIYGKVGGGWAQDRAELQIPGVPTLIGSSTDGGWLFGGGLEYAFKPNWTVKLEYDHLGLGNWTASTLPLESWSRDVQMITMGVNYKFYGGAATDTDALAPSRVRIAPGELSHEDAERLARAAQNPIADMISVPFQNNANFNVGPFDRTQDVLNIQPVVPLHLGSDWIVISRTIVPLISQPDPIFNSSTYGIGDTNQSLILSPVASGIKDFSWGVGPILTAPTASDVILGTGKVLLGPEAVIIYTPGHWTMGAVASNSWSVGGDPLRKSVNFFNTQPFINYNIPEGHGWYLTSSPIITADWNATPGGQWTVPLGGGIGRIFKIADQPFNAQAQAFYNVVRAGTGSISTPGDWQFRFEVALLFPEH